MPWTVLLYSLIVVFIRHCTCISLANQNNQELGKNITKILDSFFDSGKYDRRVRPNYGMPVEVGVTLHILTISSVSEVQMDFTNDFYFRQVWTDSRLAFTETDRIKELSVGAEVADKIWVPDTFFANEKSAYFHEATTMNTFLRIGSKGKVYRSIRLTVTANCPMDLQYFPMDRQKCLIEIESYGYSMSDIIYFWKDGDKSIGIDESLTLPQFSVAGYKQRDKKVNLSTGNYSRLLCEIQLIRSMGYYMIQIYVPASLIVMISWVSFWLHRNATPARVQLGVVTVLTMTTLMSSTNSQLPKISYVKSIDVFLGTCFVMVFAALIEYAAVGYIGKRIQLRKHRSNQPLKEGELQRRMISSSRMGDIHFHPSNSNAQCQSNVNNINFTNQNALTSAGQLLIDHNQLYPPNDNQLVIPQIHQLVQLSGNMLSSTTQPTYAQISTTQMPSSSAHHPTAQYATIRRNVLERTGATPRIVHRSQDVRHGVKALTTTQSTEDEHGSNNDLRKTCNSQSMHNLAIGQPQLIQRNVPGCMTHVGPSASTTPHLNHPTHLPTTSSSSANVMTPSHLEHFNLLHPSTRTIATSTPGRKINSKARNMENLCGMCPSDIDKYSRVIFPVCFVCFNLMYWIIFMHISQMLDFDSDESGG